MRGGFYALSAFITGFVIAQILKVLLGFIRARKAGKKWGIKELRMSLWKSGGMPSGHSSSCLALTTFLGLSEGFDSIAFALAASMSIIIIYDAVNVRHAVGEHGKLLNEIARSDKNERTNPQKLVEGHTVPQAIAGIILGVIIGYIFFVFFKMKLL